MTAIAIGVHIPAVMIVAVIVSGAFIGINNTLTTQAVMLVSPVERPVASSAYGFVRFIGGGLAPYVAGRIADATSLSVPFYLGGVAFVLAIAVLASGHRLVSAGEQGVEGEPVSPSLEPVRPTSAAAHRPVIVAVGATDDAAEIVDAAGGMARAIGSPIEVVHVRQTVVIEELAVDPEDAEHAYAAVRGHLDRLAAQGVAATGQVLHSVGDHAAAGRVLARHANDGSARVVAIGRSPHGPVVQFAEGSFTTAVTHATTCPVVLLRPEQTPVELTTHSLSELRARSA
jgi:nucleotide-binding universal stress UspA family protein